MLDIRVIQVDFAIKGSGSFYSSLFINSVCSYLSTTGVTCIAEVA